MNAIDNILNRNSPRELVSPHPNEKEMETIYKCALRAPDHAWLRPSRFIQVTGKGLSKLSEIFYCFAKDNINNIGENVLERAKKAPFRAPMIVVIVSSMRKHPKVPEIEQMLSTAAAAQNILLALNALNYGGIWRTGPFALNEAVGKYLGLKENDQVLGYLYVGTVTGNLKKIPQLNVSEFVTKWS